MANSLLKNNNMEEFCKMRHLVWATGALIVSTIISFLVLSSSYSFADVVDDVTITVPVSCNMTSELNTPHTATINPGQNQSNIGTTTFKTICNDNSGYAIYAIGYSNEEYGNTKLLATINNTLNPTYDINTGTATSGTSSAWAMKLNPVAGTYAPTIENGFSAYSNVPTTYTKVATLASGTDAVIGSSLQSTYQVYVTSTQPAGTYQGKVRYTLVHPNDGVVPKLQCNPDATTIDDAICLQDFVDGSEQIASTMILEQQYVLKDKRDGKEYTIAKLADDNVWMTQNLDLDLDSSKTYTNEDTDLGYNPQTRRYESASWKPSRSTYAPVAGHTHSWCNGGTWYVDQYGGRCTSNNTPESYDPGGIYWNGTIDDYVKWQTYHNSCDTSANEPVCDQSLNPIDDYTTGSSEHISQYHLGNYYNWTAVIAMNDSANAKCDVTGNYDCEGLIEQSICPAGWTIPRSGEGEDSYYDMWMEYGYDDENWDFAEGTNNYWAFPLFFGHFTGYLEYVGESGYAWTSVSSGPSARYAYQDNTGWVYPTNSSNRSYGYTVRCMARPVSNTFLPL